jgi:hypothetical protein
MYLLFTRYWLNEFTRNEVRHPIWSGKPKIHIERLGHDGGKYQRLVFQRLFDLSHVDVPRSFVLCKRALMYSVLPIRSFPKIRVKSCHLLGDKVIGIAEVLIFPRMGRLGGRLRGVSKAFRICFFWCFTSKLSAAKHVSYAPKPVVNEN